MYSRMVKSSIYKYIIYTIFFVMTSGYLIYRAFHGGYIATGGSDAITQMYPAMLYIGRNVREFFQAMLAGDKYTFPMVEWSLGMGENTISTLNYYGLGDPFYLLSAFFSEEKMPYFYTVFFYFRLYLGGIFCIAFFEELDDSKTTFSYILGALVYVFSGFTLQSNIFIIFVHAVMYTPMLFLGAERIMNGKKRGMLVITVWLYALSGFFFLYVCSISLAVYVICRMLLKRYGIRSAIQKIISMLVEYMTGIALSAVIFVPAVVGFLSSNRANVYGVSWHIISWQELKQLILNMFFPQYNNTQTMSVASIVMVSILLVFINRKKSRQKVGIILVFLCLIIPGITTIMSGFGGYYDRWEIVLILYFAYITFIMWDDLKSLSYVQRIIIFLIYVILGILSKKYDLLDDYMFGYTVICLGIIVLFLVFICPISNRVRLLSWMRTLFAVIIAFTVCRGWIMVARDMEIELVRQEDVIRELIPDEEESFYRIDYEKVFGEPRFGMNISLTLDYPGISEYYSIENPNYINAFGEWETGKITHNNEGLDQRTILETLSTVRYYVGRKENENIVPWGFSKVKTSRDGQWNLYENRYALPVAYTYTSIYPYDKYELMSGLEKQQVLLQAAVIEGYEGNVNSTTEIENHLHKLDYEVTNIQNGFITERVLSAQQGTALELKVDLPMDCECYLSIEGNPQVSIDLGNGYIKYREPITLGKTDSGEPRTITITFEQAIELSLDEIELLYLDFNNYKEYIAALKDEAISHIQVGTNRLTYDVDSGDNKIVCVAIPYEKGWSAYIDGEKTRIYRTNSMFMSIEIPKGKHSIAFEYITPGLKTGAWISSVSFVALLGYAIIKIIQKRVHMK